MKTNNIIRILLFLAAVCSAEAVLSQDKQNMFNPVNTAATFMSIAPDARGGGMGDIGAATEADVNSQYWNPAKYPFNIARAGVGISYTPWLRKLVNDINLAHVAGFYRIGDYSAVQASLRYFSLGEVYLADMDDMTIKPYEMAIDAGYSRMLSQTFSMAVNLRFILSDIKYDYTAESSAAKAFAADIAMYRLGYFMNKLLVPTPPKQEEGESPEDFMARVNDEGYYGISSIAGIFKSFGDAPGGFKEEMEEIQWSIGAEYTYNDRFMLRAGYHHEAENKGNRKYFTVGAGFHMSVFTVDAAYVFSTAQTNPLDQTMRFSLAFDLDGMRDLFGKMRRRR